MENRQRNSSAAEAVLCLLDAPADIHFIRNIRLDEIDGMVFRPEVICDQLPAADKNDAVT
ncbi:hypothetical protein [Arthrobacter sp. AD-310]